MYEAYYGLREKPFSILPDPELIYWGQNHRLAFAMLEFGVMNGAGFTVITGEIGSGKTTLLRYLLTRLDPKIAVGLISNTPRGTDGLLAWVMMSLDQPFEGSYAMLFKKFHQFLHDEHRKGRRVILMTASGGMAVALACLVIGLNVQGAPPALMLVSILFYVAFFAFGMGPGPWLIISEIFPTKVRGRAASIATSTLWSGALLVTFTFLSLVRVLKLSGTFAVFGALSLVCFLYVWKAVPETKGRTLEQIQESWSR